MKVIVEYEREIELGDFLRVLRKPTLKSAEKVLKDSLREKRTIVIVGKCVVNYKGRASSKLPEGERVVILKPDGTLLDYKETS